ncbi:hypothetical protein NW759_003900 [Fusarium solani]|nr:hypothetical protein NW759_003900 [Fusarium solani]
MSDPLSVAGTAVGITSLGIQVCQGLVWYLHSVHGRRAEITDDLNEVQALISIFYSLNDILPKLNQTRCTEVTTITRCLEDSEGKLLELNQLLIKLSSPQQPTTSREKMREAGRTLVYPFRADTLKSLRQSMRELLNNLNLAIDTTSLQVQVTNHDKIDDISRAIQDLGIQSKDANVGVQDLNTKMNENRSQLRSLEYTITNFLTQISHRVSQVEVTVKDIENNLAGKLNNVEAKIASTCQAITEVLTEAKRPENSQSAEMSQLSKGIETSNIQHQGVSSSTGAPEQVARHGSTISSPSRRGPPVCICEQRIHRSCFSLAFWNFKFEFQQQTTAKHRHRCKIVGIDGETQRRIKAQFPLKVAWLSARMTLACLEYTSGVSNMTLSVSYKNTVPRRFSPILRELVATGHGIVASRSAEETIQLLEGTERAILSLYREREASPRDLDEDGRCHLRMFIDIFANLNYPWMYTLGWEGSECEQLQNRVWCDDSVLAMVLRILQVLDKVVQSNDINV